MQEKPKQDNPTAAQLVKPTHTTEVSNPFKRFGAWYWRHKKWTIVASIFLLLILLLAIPLTRYPMIGWFWKQTMVFTVKDSRTGSPVSEASLTIAGKTSKTDKTGIAKLDGISVGPQKIEITKKYYKTYTNDVLVSEFGGNNQSIDVSLEATGRQVSITVQNIITNSGIEDATVSIGDDNHATTGENGKATIVVPADKNEIEATITAKDFNNQTIKLAVADDPKKNTFKLVPDGSIYFLSKQSGKVDVVKTNLDGTDRKTVFAGTGREDDNTTALLASRDWKYLVLKSKRDANKKPSLYLISTADDTVVPLDEGNAEFSLVGWSSHRFIYKVNRDVPEWQNNRTVLKSFNAETKQIASLDQTSAEGNNQFDSRYELIDNPYILENTIIYTKIWNKHYQAFGVNFNGKQSAIFSIKPDGTGKQTLKSFDPNNIQYINASLYAPQEIYFGIVHRDNSKPTYLEFEDGAIKNAPADIEPFERPYPTYLISPNGKETFWSESRDGKNVLFVGDMNGEHSKQVASLSDYAQYGWFTDEYLLISKNRSELFIVSKDGLKEGQQPLKISDYHKPFTAFLGYGYGYGGI